MQNKNDKNKKRIIKIAIIICVILIIVLLLLLNILKKKQEEQIEVVETITEEERQEKLTDYVRVKGEKERMQLYLADFLKHIEEGEYSICYKKLYPEFKNNFFDTEGEFISYIKAHYSSLMMVDYEEIERQGNYYILSVKITNLEGRQTEITQKFIILENGLNDYYISFQVQF